LRVRLLREKRNVVGLAARMWPKSMIDLRLNQGPKWAVALYVAMVAVIVGVDVVFFRNRFWERLIVNIGIVLVFAAFYLRFLRLP
jgi:hypothetical protein